MIECGWSYLSLSFVEVTMDAIGALSLGYVVVAVLIWLTFLRARQLPIGERGIRRSDVLTATRVALGWPILLVIAAVWRGVDVDVKDPIGHTFHGYRRSPSRSTQRVDEVGRSVRVLRSGSDGKGRLVIDLVSSDLRLVPDRHSGGIVCSIVLDKWTIAQLSPLIDRAVYASTGDLSVDPNDVAAIGYVPDVDDDVIRDARSYLHRLVEVGSPPVHPLLGAAIASLVAASEASDLGVMSREEMDVVDSILDFVSREDKSRIARAVAILVDDLRLGTHNGAADECPICGHRGDHEKLTLDEELSHRAEADTQGC
jgi:hypothetical protein